MISTGTRDITPNAIYQGEVIRGGIYQSYNVYILIVIWLSRQNIYIYSIRCLGFRRI